MAFQPVSWWESRFPFLSAQSQAGQALSDLDGSDGSHAMYRAAYNFFDGLVAMWRASNNTQYLDEALDFVEACMARATVNPTTQYNDGYLGWRAFTLNEEHSLREAFLWRYVTVMLREMWERPALLASSNYQIRYDNILAFTETHIYDKWRVRGGGGLTEFYRNRTHMASHWAHIGMNLEMIGTTSTIRTACADIHAKIAETGMSAYGGANLKSQLVYWTSTPGGATGTPIPTALHWTNEWGQTPTSLGWPTDTNHGAAEVGYICEAFDYGQHFTQTEIDGILELTNQHILPTSGSQPPTWISFDPGFTPPGYGTLPPWGNLFTEGFVKLGRYNETLQNKLETYTDTQPHGYGGLQGNGALSAAILAGQEPGGGGGDPPPPPPGGDPVPITLIHSEAQRGTDTKTIPLAAHAGGGRKALVIASWQGPNHTGADNMGATPAPFQELARQPWTGGWAPSMLVWIADIDTASNVNLPISNAACGFVLYVFEGVASFAVGDNTAAQFGSSYGVTGNAYDAVVGAVSTNAIKTDTALTGPLTSTFPPTWDYSDCAGAHAIPGNSGSFTWSGDEHYAGMTVELGQAIIETTWENAADTVVAGNVVGSGLGTDVNSTDENGLSNAAGQTLEYLDGWVPTPAGPGTIQFIRTRGELPSDYPNATEGYAVTYQIEDNDNPPNIVVAETAWPPQGGGPAGVIPGEARVFEAGPFTNLTWPDGGALVNIRTRWTPTPVSTLRPGGGGAPGRLARPRMVELWRSQGQTPGGPSLTVADYYVDPTNGSDGNSGTSTGSAWRTMAHAMAQTDGAGVGIGYLSGTITNPIDLSNQAGSGTSFHDRMNTHYVLDGHTVTWSNDWRGVYAIKMSHMRYLQFSGFIIDSTVTGFGGIVDGSYGINIQDYQDLNDSHHNIVADCVVRDMTGSGIAGFGTRYMRVLGCEIYDCGTHAAVGGSGMTFNDCDRSGFDTTPAGYVNNVPIDIWVQACYVTGSRQYTDSYGIPGGAGNVTDGNAYAIDWWHTGTTGDYPIRAAFINNIAHNSGGKSFNCYNAADEAWWINNLAAYGGRHIEFANTGGDPINTNGWNVGGQVEFVTTVEGGRTITAHYWNNLARGGSWMTSSPAFTQWIISGGAGSSVDAQNNRRTGTYQSDGYSTLVGDPGFTVDGLDGSTFDPRPTSAGSTALTGGNLALLALCEDDQRNQVTTDFAGNTVASSGTGHVGPYSVTS